MYVLQNSNFDWFSLADERVVSENDQEVELFCILLFQVHLKQTNKTLSQLKFKKNSNYNDLCTHKNGAEKYCIIVKEFIAY